MGRSDRLETGPTTLSHLVETVVNDDPITRCGRKLKRREGTTLLYEESTKRACYRCKRPDRFLAVAEAAEDRISL